MELMEHVFTDVPVTLPSPYSSVVKVSPAVTLIGAVLEGQKYDFVMCNPPFYEDAKDK